MILGVLQTAGRKLFAALIVLSCLSDGSAQDLQRRALAADDQQALNALLDDDIQGNCATAFAFLFDRGSAAKQTLLTGLDSEDWQQRFLSAVLLAPLKPEQPHLDKVCRILIGHLPDNQIRGDALLAGHALIVIGIDSYRYLHAASWHAEGQLGAQCKLLKRATSVNSWSEEDREQALRALANSTVSLRWCGDGQPAPPAMSAALPTKAQLQEQAFTDLASDHRRGNALGAYSFFHPYTVAPKRQPSGDPDRVLQLLENALLDSDRQRRLIAGYSLMLRDQQPSTALLKVAMESLELDDFHGWAKRGVPLANAGQAFDYFLRHPIEARPFLMEGLNHSSYAVRLRSAATLAWSREWQTERYVPILLEHLADNDVDCDATMAAESMAYLGAAALPWLDRVPVDQQQAFYFDVIRRSIAILEHDADARIPIPWNGMTLFTAGDGY